MQNDLSARYSTSSGELTGAAAVRIAESPRTERALLREFQSMALCTNFAIAADSWPRWQMMWLTAFAIYCGCKWLTLARADVREVSFERKAAYLFAWPGLDANRFLGRSIPSRPGWAEWTLAISKLGLGIVILYRIMPSTAGIDVLIRGWVGLLGLAFVLHCGLFHVLSCLWRAVGVDARPLMEWPIAATSIGEFWGRRWNRAFRDLTYRFLFRPLIPPPRRSGRTAGGFPREWNYP